MRIKLIGKRAYVRLNEKAEDLKRIAKFKPDALVLKNDEGTEIFKIAVAPNGSYGRYGVVFDEVDKNGLAMICVDCSNIMKGEVVTKEEFVEENAGILNNLKKIEKRLDAEMNTITRELSDLEALIEEEDSEDVAEDLAE